MISINQFKCKIGKYDLTCELNGNDIGFRVQSMPDILLYQGFYNNDTLPYQCKAYFNHSVARLYNYIKDKPSTKLRFNHCELIVSFQLIGQQKHLGLYMEQKQLGSNDFIMMIQRLNQNNQELKQQNAVLLKEKMHQSNTNDFAMIQKLNKTIEELKEKNAILQRQKKHQPSTNDLITTIQKLNKTIQELKQRNNILSKQKKYLDQKYGLLKDVKQRQQGEQKQKIDYHIQKINNLQSLLKAKQNQIVQSSSKVVKKKKKGQSESEYQYSEDDDNDQKHLKGSKNKPLQNMNSIKDQFVIVWKQKKDITDKIQHLSRFPDCLTVKISGKQGENGNQGIKQLSQILPRIQQLKNILTLNLYFNNHQFGKGVSITFWEVLRAAIIAHLKIKFFNIIVGPKTFKQNQKILQKQMQQYPKKITVSLQIQGWK